MAHTVNTLTINGLYIILTQCSHTKRHSKPPEYQQLAADNDTTNDTKTRTRTYTHVVR